MKHSPPRQTGARLGTSWLRFALVTVAALELGVSVKAAGGPSAYTVFPEKAKQVIRGLGFEIQSDSIGSGNHGLPEEPVAVPHDLVPDERERLAKEMLQGFRYCRLAGGLYWRGLDAERKTLRPRWPGQLAELRDLLHTAGVEGLSFEYWSPAPYWKGNQSYVGTMPKDPRNRLRCFSPGFADDPLYHGDTDRFLADFAQAVVADIRTLHEAGLKVALFGLQNEPDVNHTIYSTCEYPDGASYVRAFAAVARAVREQDKSILIFADTSHALGGFIGAGMKDPQVAALVDAYAIHIVGSPSEKPRQIQEQFPPELPRRPWFQNEYEYLTGGATPERCLNTVQHIMNSFQLAENPTWFWIHALKPLKNAEASGYSLGFWKSLADTGGRVPSRSFHRWPNGPDILGLPETLHQLEMLSVKPAASGAGIGWYFLVDRPVKVYLLAQTGSEHALEETWRPTGWEARWGDATDAILVREFPAGKVEIPAPAAGQVAHTAFIEPVGPERLKVEIGMNLPVEIRSEAIERERRAAQVQPGHWIFNPYNWNAVGSFVKRMPWDCQAVEVNETSYDPDARIFAFRKPNGKLTIVLSNRTAGGRTFAINTGLSGATFKGFRYTPENAGEATLGVAVGDLSGGTIAPTLLRMTWEFWEQQ